jgi:hypothetical protein
MQHQHVVESIDRCLQDVTKVSSHFSGIFMLFGGNWAQILPVVSEGTRGEIVNACLCQSYVWQHFKVLFITVNMRAVGTENVAYTSWLDNMSTDRSLNRALPLPSFFQIYTYLTTLISNIFPTDRLKQRDNNHTHYPKRAILAPINDSVSSLNTHMLGLFNGEEEVLHSVNSANVNR